MALFSPLSNPTPVLFSTVYLAVVHMTYMYLPNDYRNMKNLVKSTHDACVKVFCDVHDVGPIN